MVFESLVVDLMNKYLGAYIENLDASQLKLGIWGGNAVLENLHVKGDALKDLDLPVQIKFGYVGKLTLKIPWKNLYKEAVEANLDGLYLLAVPNSEIVYDAEKEVKREQDAKQAQLKAIEDQQLKSKKGPPKVKKDNFAEKLATQVIKNLQIHVRNIHIRYEDTVTIKERPFSCGVTLHSLNFETTNENWIPCLLDESIKIIYKMIDLQCLAVYWNPAPDTLLTGLPRDTQLNYFKATIATSESVPEHFGYIIKPIMLQVRLRLNPRSETDLSMPKVMLTVLLQEIGLRLAHVQYHGVMELVESMDRMAVNAPFRKYKPTVPLSGNASLWWKYAYNSILSTGVIVPSGKWSWSNIKEHKRKIKEYKQLYKEKLKKKKPPKALNDKLIALENHLDVFNITLARQTAELELVKAGQKIQSKQSVHQPKEEAKQGGWFSGWFSKKVEEDVPAKEEKAGLDAYMDDEQKKGLYQAIGYSEDEKLLDSSKFEKTYVGLQLNVDLQRVSLELSDPTVSDKEILSLRLINVSTVVNQRPSNQALEVTAHMSSFFVDGIAQGDFAPCLVTSNIESIADDESDKEHLLTVLFEIRPLDETCDQRIVIDSQPLQITYDAKTINCLSEFFKPPSDVQLQQLRAVAASAYDDIKDVTATGLKHVMENRNVVEIGIQLASSYVILPKNGMFKNDEDCLVLDLGHLAFHSSNECRTPLMKRQKESRYAWMKEPEVNESLNLEEMRSKVYDNFTIELTKIQLLFARKGQDWMAARQMETSSMHILEPLNISVLLQKCMILNDAALPKLKISGNIPSLRLRMSDLKVRDTLMLFDSIPFPSATGEEAAVESMVLDSWVTKTDHRDMKVLNNVLTGQFTESTSSMSSSAQLSTDEEFFTAESEFGSDMEDGDVPAKMKQLIPRKTEEVQMTNLKVSFSINEMMVTIVEEQSSTQTVDFLKLHVGTLSLALCLRTWDTTVAVCLHSISVQLLQFTQPNGSPLYLVDSEATRGSDYMLQVEIIQAKKQSPEFQTVHDNTEQKLILRVGTLKVAVHAQALLQLIKFARKCTDMQLQKATDGNTAITDSTSPQETKKTSVSVPSGIAASKTKTPSDKPIVKMFVQVELDCVEITVMDQVKIITNLKIQAVKTLVTITDDALKVAANLHGLVLSDASEDTMYKNIVSSAGDRDVLLLELINYNNATEGQEAFENTKNVNTSVHVRFGSTRVVFLNKFVQTLMDYGKHFSEIEDVTTSARIAAREKAAEKALELRDSFKASNPRIRLDVTIFAPTVLVPTHSKSLDAIVTDLGTLTVINKFSGCRLQQGFAVSDEMVVALKNMKISKCSLDENLKPTKETVILEEVSLSVEIIRNLSVSWYHDVPDIIINGRMPPISVKLSQSDFASVMEMLDGNLKEGTAGVEEKITDIKSETALETVKPSSASEAAKKEAKPTPTADVRETIKINYQLDDFMVQFFTDADRNQPLSKLQLLALKIDICMRNDQSSDINLAIEELALCDTRESSVGGITKLIQNRSQMNGSKLISAKIVQSADGATAVEAVISSISVIISAEFIAKLVDYFFLAIPSAPAAPVVADREAEGSKTQKAITTSEQAQPDGSTRSKAIRVSFRLEEPEIVLVTDVKSLDAEAIVLKMMLKMNYDMIPEDSKQLIAATINNLRLDGCSFKTVLERGEATSSTHKIILAPCDITLAGMMSVSKQDFDVMVSDIRLKVSPVIINTISEVVAHLTLPPKEQQDKEKEETKKEVAALDIWKPKKISAMNFWFMKENVKAIVESIEEEDGPNQVKEELAKFAIPLLQITLEAGSRHLTIPLLLTECSMKGHAANWSSGEMSGEFVITVGAGYFNDGKSVWEPLIEPTEKDPSALTTTHEPWKLVAQMQQRKPLPADSEDFDLSPLMSISIESKNILQTTMSSAALKVLKELGVAFKDAALSREFGDKKKASRASHAHVDSRDATIIVVNNLGRQIHVDLGNSLRVVDNSPKAGKGYLLEKNDRLLLDYIEVSESILSSIMLNQASKLSGDGSFIYVHLETGNICAINVAQTGQTLHMTSSKTNALPFVAEVKSLAGVRTILLRSHVVLHNHMSMDLEVYENSAETSDSPIGFIRSKHHLSITPQVAATHAVKIRPIAERGDYARQVLSWKEAAETNKDDFHVETLLRLKAEQGSAKPINLSIEFENEHVQRGQEVDFTGPGILIHLRPTVIFHNDLPYEVDINIVGKDYDGEVKKIDAGHQSEVLDAEIGKNHLQVKFSYRGHSWCSTLQFDFSKSELSPWVFNDIENKEETLTLAKQTVYNDGVAALTLYSPYWMVNKTGLPLDYKAADHNQSKAIQHPETGQDIVMFSYTSKSFLATNKLQTRACNSNFSDSFSIDTIGSSGTITCKTKQFNYMLGIRIDLTSFSLTKIITFTSYYSFHNKSDVDVEISESGKIWLSVAARQKINFWPEENGNVLVARLKGVEDAVSVKFRYNKLDSGVLIRLKDYALFVEVSITEMSVDVSVRNYFDGASAVLVVNDTNDVTFECWQGKDNARTVVEVGDTCHLLWSNPTTKREITWLSSSKKEVTMDVFREQSSGFTVSETDNKSVYYVLFVDGLQRTLLFTEDEYRAKAAEASIRFERSTIEIDLSLHGLSCSLVDSSAKREVAFVSITSSGLVWEEKRNKRWKPLAIKFSQLLETAYQHQLQGVEPKGLLELDEYAFDLRAMKVMKPRECSLRRTFTPGIWIQFASTSQQMTLHAKLNRLQVDNQLIGAVFPVVFSPVPLPKSIAVDSAPKPFLEVSLMERVGQNQAFIHYKYMKLLVQEFAVKLDVGFLTAMLKVFGAEQRKSTPEQELKYFKNDIKFTTFENESTESSSASVNFFDILHLSPIKVHVSYSLQNTLSSSESDKTNVAKEVVTMPVNALSVVLQSIGVTLSDVDDVIFRLAYFERKFQFFSSADFGNAVKIHYVGQALKQLYVLVLGLDVIGNPYGLVMGIAEGVTDLFYEPYQGIIQGPGEFFEGLGIGALSLIGHTVGGAAGAVSKVTGALGKGVASITMDEEFKRKRLIEKNKQPADLSEGLARGGKGLLMGVISGITGVVTKPIEGAEKEGAAGFFKGFGKGLIGVVARPVSGVIDLASNTFEGIQRVADMSEEVRKIRPARWINPRSGIIHPYSLRRAQGAAILQEIDEGKFAEQSYLNHVPLKENKKSVLMLTNKLVMTAFTGDFFGQWEVGWKCLYTELTEEPVVHDKVIRFSYKESQAAKPFWERIDHSRSEGAAQQIGKTFRPFTKALSFGAGATKNAFSLFSKPSLRRGNTVIAPSARYTEGKAELKLENSEVKEEEQSKTKSLFGIKSRHESVTFQDKKYIEFIMPVILRQRKHALEGSTSTHQAENSSSDCHTQ